MRRCVQHVGERTFLTALQDPALWLWSELPSTTAESQTMLHKRPRLMDSRRAVGRYAIAKTNNSQKRLLRPDQALMYAKARGLPQNILSREVDSEVVS
jgi:hypothetical protein